MFLEVTNYFLPRPPTPCGKEKKNKVEVAEAVAGSVGIKVCSGF